MSNTTARILRTIIILLIPMIIILGVVRILATSTYLSFEYGKSSFPVDQFGFDPAMRLTHAIANFRYVRDDLPPAILAEEKHDQSPLYNSRELKHMLDVQDVFQIVSQLWSLAIVLLLVILLIFWLQKKSWPTFISAVKMGSLVTAGIIAVVGLLAVLAWKMWFLVFHEVFFAAGSWTFNFSDTLIRLFPEKFWFDAAVNISLMSLVVSLIIFISCVATERLFQQ